jgi:pimeloyl-ACP methyl ester carboxylesterase
VGAVLAFGVKIDWSAGELAKARELASRPTRTFATRQEAIDRYLKISGLHGLVSPESEEALLGINDEQGAYRVAMDPRVYAAVGPSVEGVLGSCTAPLRLAAGADDPMVSRSAMRRIDPLATTFDGAGHNVHWEAPELLWRFVEDCIDASKPAGAT